MDVDRAFPVSRRELCLGLLGLIGLASGCDEGGTPPPPTTPEGVKPGEAEAKARMKAYGTTGQPKVTKGGVVAPKTKTE